MVQLLTDRYPQLSPMFAEQPSQTSLSFQSSIPTCTYPIALATSSHKDLHQSHFEIASHKIIYYAHESLHLVIWYLDVKFDRALPHY